jgi:hypothetical protein
MRVGVESKVVQRQSCMFERAARAKMESEGVRAFENRSCMCGYRLKRVQIQSARREPCAIPRLKPTVGLARNGDLVGCKLGISGGGWLIRLKFKEMLYSPRGWFHFRIGLHAQNVW